MREWGFRAQIMILTIHTIIQYQTISISMRLKLGESFAPLLGIIRDPSRTPKAPPSFQTGAVGDMSQGGRL